MTLSYSRSTWRFTRCLWAVAFILLTGCGDDSAKKLDEAQKTGARGDQVSAATLLVAICQEHPKSAACETAKELLPTTRLVAARQLLGRHEYREAKRMLELITSASGDVGVTALELLKSPDLAAGLRWEAAHDALPRNALSDFEELAASKSRIAPLAAAWLEQKRPGVLLELARESCTKKPPTEDCGKYASRLLQLHPKAKEAKEAETLVKAFARVPLEEGQTLEWQGKLTDAAARYDEVCRRAPNTAVCKTASQKADAARLRAATAAIAAMDFTSAKTLYETVARSPNEGARKQAQTQLDAEQVKSGLALERAKTAQSSDKRVALAQMEEIAKANTPAGGAAKAWIAKERPGLYLEDATSACKPASDQCPVKCKQLLTAHPGTPQAGAAKKLLADWENEPLVAAELLAKDGKVLAAATEYDLACTRAPESATCAKAGPLATEARIRGGREAMAIGQYIEAKKAFETALLASKDETKKSELRRTLESSDFIAGVAKETRGALLASARVSCADGLPDCTTLVADFVKAAPEADGQETKKLLADYATVRSASDAALAKAEALATQCVALSQSEAMQARCYPRPFAKYAAGATPSDSPVDRLALATAYASGANGPPSPGAALRGLILLGAVVGAFVGVAIQLFRRGKPALGVLAIVAGGALVGAVVFGAGGQEKTRARYVAVGLDDH